MRGALHYSPGSVTTSFSCVLMFGRAVSLVALVLALLLGFHQVCAEYVIIELFDAPSECGGTSVKHFF
jgi:hypothetical protein